MPVQPVMERSTTRAVSWSEPRSTHSVEAWAPAPSTPKSTAGIPASASRAASVQKASPRWCAGRPVTSATTVLRGGVLPRDGAPFDGDAAAVRVGRGLLSAVDDAGGDAAGAEYRVARARAETGGQPVEPGQEGAGLGDGVDAEVGAGAGGGDAGEGDGSPS